MIRIPRYFTNIFVLMLFFCLLTTAIFQIIQSIRMGMWNEWSSVFFFLFSWLAWRSLDHSLFLFNLYMSQVFFITTPWSLVPYSKAGGTLSSETFQCGTISIAAESITEAINPRLQMTFNFFCGKKHVCLKEMLQCIFCVLGFWTSSC